MKIIIYKTENNGVAVLYPTSFWNGTLEELAIKDVPPSTPWRIVNASDIPSDDIFRNAWEWED